MKSPTHEEIARRAYQLWQKAGQPAGRDEETWLAAERQLTAKTNQRGSEPSGAGFAERARIETAVESEIEFYITPAIADEAAIRAALQNEAVRARPVA